MPVAIPLAIAGSTLAAGAISANASKSAAKTVQQGTDRAADLQNQQFEKLLALQMPGYNRAEGAAGVYSQALGLGSSAQGQGGASQQGLMTGSYGTGQVGAAQQVPGGGQLDIAQQVMQTPGYQTQLNQGMKSIDRAAPLVGGMYSGRRMKALNDYGQQTFGSYYNDWMNRVGGIAGQSQQIASNVGNQGMQNAQNVGNLMMTGANARANGALNSASAWSGALGNIAGMAGGYYG